MNALVPRKAAIVLAGLLGACLVTWAQSPPVPGARMAPLPRSSVLPHEANPNAWPQPDYFGEALKGTPLKPDGRSGEVVLQKPPADAPARRYGVLPVQTQAFGYGPGFRALAGALLDRELAARGLQANRQTEVSDAYGPFVRRLGDDALDAFAQQHRPSGGVLALYLGHDGNDTTFVTLLLKDGAAAARRAHRSIALPGDPREAVGALAAVVPQLLQELGLTGNPVPPVTAKPSGCRTQIWELASPRSGADATELACHALAVGTLMPRLSRHASSNGVPADLPGRTAWLAMAFVEAGPGAKVSETHAAIQALAWAQLMDAGSLMQPAPWQQISDPVAGPLASLLTTPARAMTQPVRSSRETIARQVDRASARLPGFARVAFIEKGAYDDGMRQVDACALERAYPGAMVTAKCRDGSGPSAAAGQATPAQAAIYQQWRLAAFHKDIVYFGRTLGDRQKTARLLASLPEDVARHPLIQKQRFVVDGPARIQADTFEAQLSRTRDTVRAFVQSTVDAQRYDDVLLEYSLTWHQWTANRNIAHDPEISSLQDAERRMLAALTYDRFVTSDASTRQSRRKPGDPVDFLATVPGPLPSARLPSFPALDGASGRPAGSEPLMRRAASPVGSIPLFPLSGRPPLDAALLRAQLAAEPRDMDTRVALAMRALKEGAPASKARALIDAQPVNQRTDERIRESHTWATPAHAYYFAGDLESARTYYERVRQIGTYSDSDLLARVRVRMIDGDIRGALAATEERAARYQNDYARRDLAAFLFMVSRPEEAWRIIQPRLVSTTSLAPWMAVLTGHRLEGKDLGAASDWLAMHGAKGAQIARQEAGPMYLHLHAVMDRLPSDQDILALRTQKAWASSATLAQMALGDSYPKDRFDTLRQDMETHQGQNAFMQPLFTWAAWHATANKDPELESIRKITLQHTDFDALLAKSMLLALDGQASQSLDFLRAARFQMSDVGLGTPLADQALPVAYQYTFAAYLMFRKTNNDAYRVEALRMAKAYEKAVPFWAWTYAVDALLERDPKARDTARCRAAFLDRNSYFLSQVQATPRPTPAACAKSLW